MARAWQLAATVLCAGCIGEPVYDPATTGSTGDTTAAGPGSSGSTASATATTGAGGSSDGGGGAGGQAGCEAGETEWFPPCGGLVDSFEDEQAFATVWFAEGGIDLDGGTLNVPVNSSNGDGRAYTLTPIPLDDCQISVTLVELPIPVDAAAALFVHTGNQNDGVYHSMRVTMTDLLVEGPEDEDIAFVDFDLGVTPHIRIRATDGALFFERSADRVCWSAVASVSQPPGYSPVTTGLSVVHMLGGPTAEASFDDVNVPPP